MKKLSKEELLKREKSAQNKVKYYQAKIKKLEIEDRKIGFKFY
jgi:hypothetical protein